jgi:hypothetical protein
MHNSFDQEQVANNAHMVLGEPAAMVAICSAALE